MVTGAKERLTTAMVRQGGSPASWLQAAATTNPQPTKAACCGQRERRWVALCEWQGDETVADCQAGSGGGGVAARGGARCEAAAGGKKMDRRRTEERKVTRNWWRARQLTDYAPTVKNGWTRKKSRGRAAEVLERESSWDQN